MFVLDAASVAVDDVDGAAGVCVIVASAVTFVDVASAATVVTVETVLADALSG